MKVRITATHEYEVIPDAYPGLGESPEQDKAIIESIDGPNVVDILFFALDDGEASVVFEVLD